MDESKYLGIATKSTSHKSGKLNSKEELRKKIDQERVYIAENLTPVHDTIIYILQKEIRTAEEMLTRMSYAQISKIKVEDLKVEVLTAKKYSLKLRELQKKLIIAIKGVKKT